MIESGEKREEYREIKQYWGTDWHCMITETYWQV